MLLSEKVVLITGSARGTGAGIAHAFARNGAKVIINQVQEEGDPDNVVQTISDAGGEAHAIKSDITDEQQVRALLHEAEKRFGGIDVLVSNYAGTIPRKSFLETRWNDWQIQLDTTLKAAFLCSQAVLPHMKRRRWGRIVSINTIGIHEPRTNYHAYTSAKTAMLGFSRNLAVEVGQYNITVNIVSPGLTLTREVEKSLTPEARQKHEKRVPMRRIGTVQDTANAALFFASELGSFVTGHYMPVCGGQVFT